MERYYTLLGLKPGASKGEIKKAYRKMVMKYHPDKNPSQEARALFIQIDRAYDVLYNGKVYKTPNFVQQQRRKKQNTYKKWANTHEAPTNKRDYEEWVKVKREQQRRASENTQQRRKKVKLSPREQKIRDQVQKGGIFFLVYFLMIGVLIILYPTAFFMGIYTLILLFSLKIPDLFFILIPEAIFISIIYFIQTAMRKYFY